jgi:multiple sugar transport system substrate-binding protein
LQAASSNTFPDIALVDSDVSFPQLASSGVLADLGELGITTKGQSETVAALGDYDGTLYGLPTQVEDYALWYDKAAFAEAGIKEFPTTFEGLVDVAAKLTTPERDGISLAGKNDGSTPVYFLPFLLSSGADPADPSTADTAVGLYKDLYDAGSLSKEFVTRGWEAPDVWKEGKAAIAVTGPWELVSGLDIDYGVAPFPTAEEGGTPKVGLLGYEYVLKAQKDEHKAQAAAALLQCRAVEANQVETALKGGYIPALTSAQDAFVAEVPAAAGFVDQVAGAYNNAQLGTEWSKLQQVYVAAIQYATVEGLSPKEALAKAAQD